METWDNFGGKLLHIRISCMNSYESSQITPGQPEIQLNRPQSHLNFNVKVCSRSNISRLFHREQTTCQCLFAFSFNTI